MDPNNDKSFKLKWKYPTSYILALLSWTTGLSNIFHNPKLLLEIGLFNYLLVQSLIIVIIGIPMTLIELAISQYSLKSVVKCWDFCPFFRGIGYGKIILIIIFQVYYNVLNSYILFYCYISIQDYNLFCNSDKSNHTCVLKNDNSVENVKYTTNSETFWYAEVLQTEDNVNILGQPNWKLMVSLCGHMLLIFIFNLKRTDFLEALLPLSYNISILEFAILFCIANATSGGLEGIKYAIFRNVDLNSIFVWKKEEIILQVFQNHLYSMGLALGGFSNIAALGAFRKPVFAMAVWANLANLGNTFLYSILLINLYGILQFNTKTKIESFIKYNNFKYEFDYIFTVIPNALQYLPGSTKAWMVIFYSSLYLKGLSTSSLMTSTVLNVIYEENPKQLKHSKFWSILFCILITLLGCLFHTRFGLKAGQFIGKITLEVLLPLILSLKVITVMFIYGLLRFMKDLHFMLGTYPTTYWPLSLIFSTIITPILTSISLVTYFKYTPMDEFDIILLKAILSLVLVWIPFMGMVRIIRKVKLKLIFRSARNWGPANGLKISRKMFEEQHSVEEFLYEKYLLESKLEKYE